MGGGVNGDDENEDGEEKEGEDEERMMVMVGKVK